MKRRTVLGKILFVSLIMVVLVSPVFCSDLTGGKDLVIGKSYIIHSKILDEERPIQIYLPPGYEESRESYPVFYLLDGDIHFHHVSGIMEFLSGYTHMPRMILVSVVNFDRERDFLPTRVDDWPPRAESERFHNFLKKELIPLIERTYRTRPYRILCGHSFGGTFCINAFLEEPGLFTSYIAVSPMLNWDNELILKKAARVLQKKIYKKKFLYFTTSADDEGSIPTTRHLAALLKKNNPRGLEWHFQYMEKDDHLTVVHPTIYNGLLWLHKDWRIPERKLEEMSLRQVKNHYKQISQRYGDRVLVPEGVLFNLGYSLFDHGKKEQALEAFNYAIQLYPQLPSAYLGLGDIYHEMGKLKKALEYIKKAVQYAEIQKDNMVLSPARGMLEQITKKLNNK